MEVTRDRQEPAGGVETLEVQGPCAIAGLRAAIDFAGRQDEIDALRQLVLSITFDGRTKPAVWSPLGDSFGTASGRNLYRSLPTGMARDGFYAYSYMPFEWNAVLRLRNDGKKDRAITHAVDVTPLSRPFKGLGHFHAKWRDLLLSPSRRQSHFP